MWGVFPPFLCKTFQIISNKNVTSTIEKRIHVYTKYIITILIIVDNDEKVRFVLDNGENILIKKISLT